MAKITQILSAPTVLLKFARESRDELKKVSWPTRELTIRYTMLVIAASLVIGLIIGGIDYLLTLGIENLI